VRYRRGRADALKEFDLAVAAGEVVAVLGPNGAGKSTLLRVLSTRQRPSAGSLHLLGEDARRPSPALRRRLGVVPDEAVHLEALTGSENALLFARIAGLGDAAALRAVAALLGRLALDGDAGRPTAEYSFGMRRKLLLAEALAHEPRVLLLDEPMLGLDPPSRQTVQEVLRERAAAGAAVVLVTNDAAGLEQWCDRICFLHRGRKVLEGTPAELLAAYGDAARALEIRRPDLRDLFLAATGAALGTA
jgi:ABC-2 type transport system ATP-binding protein